VEMADPQTDKTSDLRPAGGAGETEIEIRMNV
jgi:hypothetical protein